MSIWKNISGGANNIRFADKGVGFTALYFLLFTNILRKRC